MAVLMLVAVLVAALGIGVAAPGTGEPERAANVVPLTVKTPRGGFNRMVVSLTVCEPGTERCVQVDDVMVDTGSTGLRLEAFALPPGFRPPPVPGRDGRPSAECLRFVHDVAWGPLHRVDLRIGGLAVADLPIQIIDGDAQPRPDACPASEVRPTANGTLGIGPDLTDCPGVCEQSLDIPLVFGCGPAGCEPLRGRVEPRHRLPNPVARMAGHDNGIVIALPPAPPGGAEAVTGTLTFGLGTDGLGTDGLGSDAIVRLGRNGRFTTTYAGVVLPASTIDSGTPTYVFADPALPRCEGMSWAYCAVPERELSAVILDRDGLPVPVPFRVGSFREVLDRRAGVVAGAALVAEASSQAFVWGAPFFLGRRVSVILDGRAVAGAMPPITGPAYAFR